MNEATFKAHYVMQFLATYMAQRYDNDCRNGHLGKPYDHQPVEVAHFLAECAWKQIEKHQHDTLPPYTLFAA